MQNLLMGTYKIQVVKLYRNFILAGFCPNYPKSVWLIYLFLKYNPKFYRRPIVSLNSCASCFVQSFILTLSLFIAPLFLYFSLFIISTAACFCFLCLNLIWFHSQIIIAQDDADNVNCIASWILAVYYLCTEKIWFQLGRHNLAFLKFRFISGSWNAERYL